MLFSSITFLYYFLPLTLLIYYITPKNYKNYILLIASMLFYSLGEFKFLYVLISSCIFNYLISIFMKKYQKNEKFFLVFGLIINILSILYFKYTNFFILNINNIFNINITYLNIIMPLGISFFTFQSISYLIDIYRNKCEIPKNIFIYSTYITLFPQLIAGPIVRYETINEEMNERTHNYQKFSEGIKRFVIGLAKKILIANSLGELCLILTSLTSQTILSSIIHNISFMLQIYFDFSGYSDMAIGLGLMFGFTFLENFNYPFIASSITDFWKRWHISLSEFLRDYIYFPLGGNKVSNRKWLRNIFIVWFITGFWHGASWNFIIWGLYFAIILIIEKKFLKTYLEKSKILSHIYTILLVLISFVIFNNISLNETIISLKSMFGLNNLAFINTETLYYTKSYLTLLIVAAFASTPLFSNLIKKFKTNNNINKLINFAEPLTYILLLLMCTAFLIDSSFNPFLYFRF